MPNDHTVTVPATKNWSPESWKTFKASELPDYPDADALQSVYDELRQLPPLVISWEIETLKRKLADVAAGNSFLLQGGDCAESFADCQSPKMVNLLKVLLQMSFIMIHEMDTRVVRIGRIAGQYAKPRSKEYEIVDGKKIPNYFGDLVNSIEPNREARIPDPQRLIEGYNKSALTLNFCAPFPMTASLIYITPNIGNWILCAKIPTTMSMNRWFIPFKKP